MLLGGDEIARTQFGNNNAYCQDNEVSWVHWDLDERKERLLTFTKRLIALRHAHPVFRRQTFFAGETGASKLPDVWWFRTDGRKMTRRDWEGAAGLRLGVFLNGAELKERTQHGEPIHDDSFLLIFNANHEDAVFTLPPRRFGNRWRLELSTFDPDAAAELIHARAELTVPSRSALLLRRET
jgi:isoamylase